jgi:hypothetical protein
MKPSDVLRQFDLQERIQVDFPGMARESFPDLVRFSRVGPGVNFVLYSHLEPETADGTIQAQIEEFEAFEGPFEWKTYQHDRPTGLGDRLKSHGFVPDTPAPVLCLDLDEMPASLTTPPSADIRRLVDPAELSQVVAIHERVWGGDFSWIPERFSRDSSKSAWLMSTERPSVWVGLISKNGVSLPAYGGDPQFRRFGEGGCLRPYWRRGFGPPKRVGGGMSRSRLSRPVTASWSATGSKSSPQPPRSPMTPRRHEHPARRTPWRVRGEAMAGRRLTFVFVPVVPDRRGSEL